MNGKGYRRSGSARSTLLLTGAGLAAALFVIFLPLALYVAGALFGAAIAIALERIGVFNQRQAGWFVAVSTLAYYLCLALLLKVGVFTQTPTATLPRHLYLRVAWVGCSLSQEPFFCFARRQEAALCSSVPPAALRAAPSYQQ